MNYYGGNNLPAKLRSRRRKAAKCKRLIAGGENISIYIKRAEAYRPTMQPHPVKTSEQIEKNAIKTKTPAEAKPKAKIATNPALINDQKDKADADDLKQNDKKQARGTAKQKSSEQTSAQTGKPEKQKSEKLKKEKTVKEKPAQPEKAEEKPVNADKNEKVAPVEPIVAEEPIAAEEKIETVEEPIVAEEKTKEIVTVAEIISEATEDKAVIDEKPTEEPATETEKPETIETPSATEEKAAEPATETAQTPEVAQIPESVQAPETIETPAKEQKPKDENKLDPTENADLLSRIATKRARKLIYAPKEAIYEVTGIKIDVDGKKNDKGVKVKDILEAEIKEGLRLGYLDKYDGLKTSEIKEEYENDTVWEIAEQEFKKMGLLLDGDKVKVYVFDWTGTGCHHIGYIPEDKAAELIPYLKDMDKYSFDLDGIITGGKSKTVNKDAKTGKITIVKGKDGGYGVDLDVTVINRKD